VAEKYEYVSIDGDDTTASTVQCVCVCVCVCDNDLTVAVTDNTHPG